MNARQRRLVDYFNTLPDPAPPAAPVGAELGLAEAVIPAPALPAFPTPAKMATSLIDLQERQRTRESPRDYGLEGVAGPPAELRLGLPLEPPLTDRAITAAVEAVDLAQHDQPLTREQEVGLEKIIDYVQRPVLNVVNGAMSTPPPEWAFLNDFRPLIEGMLPSIGRIDVPGLTGVVYAGTGFFVGDGLLLTNRHVAEFFVDGVGQGPGFLAFRANTKAVFDPQYEVGDPDPGTGPDLYRVREAMLVHPHWDAALIRVEPAGNAALPAPLPLASQAPPFFGSGAILNVVVVGYPYIDELSPDVPEQIRIYGNIFGRKRIAPGYLRANAAITTRYGRVTAVTHDATTLGGNSGSAVIELTTGKVVALHFGGVSRKANYGVPMWELARDDHVTGAGLSFDASPNGMGVASRAPSWLKKWTDLAPLSG